MILPGIGAAGLLAAKSAPLQRGLVQVSTQNAGTTFTPGMPAHQSGDVLLVFVAATLISPGNDPLTTTSSGWAQKAQQACSSLDRTFALFKKTATSSSESIVINNANTHSIEAHVYAFKSASGSVAGLAVQGNDPPALTPSWGPVDSRWIVACASASAPTPPSGYGNMVQTTNGAAGTLTTAGKNDTQVTIDPDIFTGTGPSTGVVTMTIALEPL